MEGFLAAGDGEGGVLELRIGYPLDFVCMAEAVRVGHLPGTIFAAPYEGGGGALDVANMMRAVFAMLPIV
jgi:hypothetical protein